MTTVNLLPGSRNLPNQLTIADQPEHSGGEGNVYLSTDGHYVVKIYHKAPLDKQSMLQKILELGKNLGDDEQFLAWPLGIVDRVDGRSSMGVVCRRVPPPGDVPLYKLIYSPIDALAQFHQGKSWLEYLKLARGAAAAVRAVHGRGIAHGDVHLKNFLTDPASAEVVLIDLDGVVISGYLLPQVKGMPGFIAPEVLMHQTLPNQLTDRYSLAVLVLWTLLLRNVMKSRGCYDPDNQYRDEELGYGQFACFSENINDRRNWIPSIGTPLFSRGQLSYRSLTPKLQELTEQALIQGLRDPRKRPHAIEWEQALADAYDALIICPTCHQSFFYQYWLQPPPRRQCPFCGAGAKSPFPTILALKEARAKGVFVDVRTIVIYHGLLLFADITESGRKPPFSRRKSATPIIGQVAWFPKEGVHRLLNMSDTPWTIISGGSGPVGRGASIPLKRGLLFSFGNGKRLAQVIE